MCDYFFAFFRLLAGVVVGVDALTGAGVALTSLVVVVFVTFTGFVCGAGLPCMRLIRTEPMPPVIMKRSQRGTVNVISYHF